MKSKYDLTMLEAYRRGYRVSNDGRTLNPKGSEISGVINIDRRGHKSRKHNIRMGGQHAAFKAHRLQAYQKFGDAMFKSGMVVRHVNDISIDNSWDNIRLGTHSDNLNDSYKNKKR